MNAAQEVLQAGRGSQTGSGSQARRPRSHRRPTRPSAGPTRASRRSRSGTESGSTFATGKRNALCPGCGAGWPTAKRQRCAPTTAHRRSRQWSCADARTRRQSCLGGDLRHGAERPHRQHERRREPVERDRNPAVAAAAYPSTSRAPAPCRYHPRRQTRTHSTVMAGLVPAIHLFVARSKTWMPRRHEMSCRRYNLPMRNER